jgi:hypothetical protein
MSLAPTNGGSGDLCKKTSQRKEKGEAFVSVSVYGERSYYICKIYVSKFSKYGVTLLMFNRSDFDPR